MEIDLCHYLKVAATLRLMEASKYQDTSAANENHNLNNNLLISVQILDSKKKKKKRYKLLS